MVGAEEDGIGGGRRSGVLIMALMIMVPVSGAALLMWRSAARIQWSRMVSVLGFMTWNPVHLTVGISTTVTLFKF